MFALKGEIYIRKERKMEIGTFMYNYLDDAF